jgi:hypothetical protein
VQKQKKAKKMFKKTQQIIFLALLVSGLAISATNVLAQQNPTLTILPSLHGATNLSQGTHSFQYLAQFNVTATPDEGYKLSCWILDGTIYIGPENPIILTNDRDHTLQAIFTLPTAGPQIQTSSPTSTPEGSTSTPASPNSTPTSQHQTGNVTPTLPTSTPTKSASKMSLTIPIIGVAVILCIVVIGLIVSKVKRKPA